MSTTHVLILGAIAGATIFLGLPVGRIQGLSSQARAGLSALATGILIFLLWDVLTGAVDPIETALDARHWGRFSTLAALGAGGFALGLMSLVYYSEWMRKRSHRRASTLVGPGAAATDEFEDRNWLDTLTPGKQLALLIAVGIGVHNFGEGLAIGQAAAANQVSLAVTLIVGFGLHNATEGFGICGPMSGEGTQPSWRFIALLGTIGGLPTFLGTRARPGLVERGDVGRLLRDRRRLDPLRRAGALHCEPQARTHRARDVARAPRPAARLCDGLRRQRGRRLATNTARSSRTSVAAASKPASSSHLELIGHAAREVHHPVDLDHRVLGSLGYDDVAEDEASLRHDDAREPFEQIALLGTVEVVHGEHGDHEVERSVGQRILEARKAEVGVGQPLARAVEHRLARVDARPVRATDGGREHAAPSRPVPVPSSSTLRTSAPSVAVATAASSSS